MEDRLLSMYTCRSLIKAHDLYTCCLLVPSTADVDYTSVVINITFNSGENSSVVAVPITNDVLPEADETFEVFLKNITGSPYDVIFADPSVAVGTIIDDEIPSENTTP